MGGVDQEEQWTPSAFGEVRSNVLGLLSLEVKHNPMDDTILVKIWASQIELDRLLKKDKSCQEVLEIVCGYGSR